MANDNVQTVNNTDKSHEDYLLRQFIALHLEQPDDDKSVRSAILPGEP